MFERQKIISPRRRIAGVVVVAAVCLLAQTLPASVWVVAAADTMKGKQAARQLLVAGAKLYEQGEFAEALSKFEAAYAAFPSPKIFFNFGQAYRGLARRAEAIIAFERFLAEMPNAEAGLRKAAGSYITELQPKVGTLVVNGGMPGSGLFVDGRPVAQLPLKGPVLIDPGPHQVSIEKPGSPSLTRRIEVFAGARVTLTGDIAGLASAPLTPAPASLGLPAFTTPAAATSLPAVYESASAAPPASADPFYKRGWFWGTVGALVAGGVVTAVALSSGTRNEIGPVASDQKETF